MDYKIGKKTDWDFISGIFSFSSKDEAKAWAKEAQNDTVSSTDLQWVGEKNVYVPEFRQIDAESERVGSKSSECGGYFRTEPIFKSKTTVRPSDFAILAKKILAEL